jgi:hypothetical protein
VNRQGLRDLAAGSRILAQRLDVRALIAAIDRDPESDLSAELLLRLACIGGLEQELAWSLGDT